MLSHSDEEGYEKGFVGADIIRKYAPEGKYSIFVCGPGGLYKFLETELPKLELERKYIRFEVFSSGKKADSNPTEYSIKVINRGEETTIKASSNETGFVHLSVQALRYPQDATRANAASAEANLSAVRFIYPRVKINAT